MDVQTVKPGYKAPRFRRMRSHLGYRVRSVAYWIGDRQWTPLADAIFRFGMWISK